jgi:RNA polymerase sigma factor (sigma-70 family)
VITPDVLERFRAGDGDAVRHVYREYGRLVFAVAHRVLGSRQLAEEATQQTFVKAWRSAAAYDPSRDLGPWLATIARRTAIDLHRATARRASVSLDEVPPADPAVAVELPAGAARVLEFAQVRSAVDALAPDEREVVRLQHFEGLTQAEIADRLGVPVGTVKSRTFRAHRRLAAALGHLQGET